MWGPVRECATQYFHSPERVWLELAFCLVIVLAYVPQYVAIWRTQSTEGISSRSILHHSLFSTVALGIQLWNPLYYPTFNCVHNGTLRWQGLSALTGFSQIIVQWLCAAVLLVLFLRYYDFDSQKETEPDALPLRRIETIVMSSAVLIPFGLFFLWHNDDAWTKPAMSWGFAIYVIVLGLASLPILALHIWTDIWQFKHQVQLLRSMKSRRILSISFVGLISAALTALVVLQILRSWPNLSLRHSPRDWPPSEILFFYEQLSLHIGYALAALGYLILFLVCLYYDWHDVLQRKFGRGRLD